MNYKLRISRAKIDSRVKKAILDALADPSSIEEYPKTVQIAAIKVLREYYTNKKELLPDSHYDEVEEIVKANNPRNAIWKTVGAPVPKGRIEVKLPVFMPSMSKIKPNTKALTRFIDPKQSYTIMDKLDGISLQLVYDKGVCVQAATRGDGAVGQDISHWIPYLRIPKKIPIKTRFIVRSEAIVKTSTFDAKHDSTKNSKGTFKAARNMAGGILNKMSSSKDFKQYQRHMKDVDVVCYEIQEGRTAGGPISKQLQLLKRLKFKTVWSVTSDNFEADDPSNSLSQIYDVRINQSDYEIDGIIVAKDIPYTPQRTNAKHAVAFKENSESAMQIVSVKSVDWEISRNKTIIPTISIDPIRLGGVTVSNFLAHSLFYIRNGFKKSDAKLGLPVKPINVGAKIKVVRSGGVIPYIVEVVKASRKPAEPPYEYKEKGVHAVYSGKSAQSSTSRVKRLTHFFVALGMDGFKESTFKKLYDLGYTSPLKIKRIRVKDLEGIESFGTQTIKKLISEVDKCLNAPNFVNFAVASGYIDNFSLERVQKIVDAYGEEVFEWEDESTEYIVDKVQALHGFKQIARNFAVALPKIFKLADNLSVDLELPQKEEAVGDLLDGEKITLTGARDKEVQAWITQQGGTVQNMKADTTMLIIKDESYTSSKVDLAEERNIPILTLEQFRRKYM